MSRIRSSILLCSLTLCLAVLAGCGYGFVLKGSGNLGPVSTQPSSNQTALRGAAMILDTHLERSLAAMGISQHAENLPRLTCTIIGAQAQEITTNPAAQNRFRLMLSVKAEITDPQGKSIWQRVFSDYGAYASGGQEENALDEACDKITDRIAQALVAIKR